MVTSRPTTGPPRRPGPARPGCRGPVAAGVARAETGPPLPRRFRDPGAYGPTICTGRTLDMRIRGLTTTRGAHQVDPEPSRIARPGASGRRASASNAHSARSPRCRQTTRRTTTNAANCAPTTPDPPRLRLVCLQHPPQPLARVGQLLRRPRLLDHLQIQDPRAEAVDRDRPRRSRGTARRPGARGWRSRRRSCPPRWWRRAGLRRRSPRARRACACRSPSAFRMNAAPGSSLAP